MKVKARPRNSKIKTNCETYDPPSSHAEPWVFFYAKTNIGHSTVTSSSLWFTLVLSAIGRNPFEKKVLIWFLKVVLIPIFRGGNVGEVVVSREEGWQFS